MSQARISAFNNLLRDIVTVVGNRFPDDRDLEQTKNQIEIALSMSPRTTITTFMQGVQPYLEKVAKQDEVFFLNYVQSDKTLKGMKLNDKWTGLDTAERNKIWRNVQKMVVLGDKILSSDM